MYLQNSITYKFYLILLEILQSLNNVNKPIDVSSFLYTFISNHKTYEGNTQHDTQEFCRLLLDDFNKDLNKVNISQYYKEINFSNKNSKILCENEFHNFCEERENSLITELFYSQIMTTYVCSCNFITYSFQKILDLPILLPENINYINLNLLLNMHFDYEDVQFEPKCEKCKMVSKHKKNIG